MKNLIAILALLIGTLLYLLFFEDFAEQYCHRNPQPKVKLQPIEEPKLRAELLFTGDWMQHTPQINSAQHKSGFDYSESTKYIKPLMQRADITIVNFETTLTPNSNYSGYPMFRSPKELADALKSAGVDVALLANNHCCDGGKRGIRTTISELLKRGILHTGTFSDSLDFHKNNTLRLKSGGIKFAFINYTYGTNGLPTPDSCIVNLIDTARIKSHLKAIERDSVDCIVACMHWGNEYERRASKGQKELAKLLHSYGVDIVVGSHPHVIQEIVADSLKVTAYSLGNFVSNQQKRYTDGGVMLRIGVEKRKGSPCRFSTKAIPVWVRRSGYTIIPPEVGDTISLDNNSMLRYNEFIKDCQERVGDYL
ncbi:MAG: CapA family protein [Alistipes sp.]|nr:CapA family protein [Alistipes sp.]